MKNFETYYKNKSKDERQKFAQKVPTSVGYLETHLLSGRKKPTKNTMENIAKATDGEFSYPEIVDFFYIQNTELKEGAA